MEEEVKRMKEYLLKQMKQKGHLSYEKQIKYLKRFKDGVLGDNPRSMAKKDAAEELLKNSEQDLAKKIEQLKESNQNTTIMNHEFLRMQELAGVPVNEEKESLNENQIGGIVGIGAIHTPKREKSDYEMAFEHFMTEGEEKEEKVKESVEETINEEDIEEDGFGKMSGDGTEGFGDMLYKGMDEAYKKHGKEVVDEILEMYKKSKDEKS